MQYAITGYFDEITESNITRFWKLMYDKGFSDYLYLSENRPHIKYCVFNEINEEMIKSKLAEYSKRINRINVHFHNIGMYINDELLSVVLEISATIEMLNLQKSICQDFKDSGRFVDENYFDSGIWKPDCFIGVGIPISKSNEMIDELRKWNIQYDGSLQKIGLIQYRPAKIIVEYNTL